MIRGKEHGAKIRAAIVDCKGYLDTNDWERSSNRAMSHAWVGDCDPLYEHLVSPKANHVDNKRLEIDLVGLRQYVWERDGERTEIADSSSGDYPRWIDTSNVLADPLTKAMHSDRLLSAMGSGSFDMVPTPESLAIKARNRELRKKAQESARPAALTPCTTGDRSAHSAYRG